MIAIEEDVFTSICTIFNESQFHASAHRKNIQSLRKIHAKCSGKSENETLFLQSICHCLHVVLAMKRPDEVSNKLMRFLIGFVVRSADGIKTAPQSRGFVERFLEGLMSHSLEHLDSKEKLVRSRLCQVMVACLNSVQELTDDIWSVFRIKMTERLFDKEAIVRVHAIHSMARLQSLPVEEESELSIIDIFLDLMQHDPSVDVRKAALLQIDVNAKSLPFIIERRKDVDSSVRKAFYSKKMIEIDVLLLTIHQRDEILNSGLTDRDSSVRQACTDMIFENWIHKTNGNLIQFLVGLDIISNAKVAETALVHFFDKMPDMLKGNFNTQFLQSMTAEMAFILRVYIEHQLSANGNNNDRQVIQDLLPELSVMNGHLRDKYNAIVVCTDEANKTELEFVLNELLRVISYLDFSDEAGRRILFETFQEIMANLETSDGAFQTCVKIFIEHCSSIQEFLDIMTEFIGSFRDVYDSTNKATADGEEEDAENDSISDHIKIMANLRALDVIRHAFSIPDISFAKYPILVAYLDEIVIHSVNSPFAAVQTAGLKCLGLCCTIEKALALEYMSLFCDFYRLGLEEGRSTALQIVFDLILLYGMEYFSNENEELEKEDENEGEEVEGDNNNKLILSILSSALYDPVDEVQLIAAEGFSKLFLHRVVSSLTVLEGLFHLYLHPSISASSGLKQCLSYFFQAYAFTAAANQLAIGSLIGKVVSTWMRTCRDNNSNTGNCNVSLNSVSNQLLYLIDSSNLIKNTSRSQSQSLSDANSKLYKEMYAQIAIDLSWAILNDPLDESSKLLCSIVSKLPLKSLNPDSPPLLKQLLFLQTQIMKYVTCKTTINLLKRFTANLLQLDTQDEPLDFEIINEMRALLVKILPTGIKVNSAASINLTAGTATTKKAVKNVNKMSDEGTGNIMDDIVDLYDE